MEAVLVDGAAMACCETIVTKFLGRPGRGTGSRVEGRHFIKLWYEGGIHLWNDKLLCGTRP